MRGFLAVLTGVSAVAAALATGSGAVATAPSGDTCSVSGSGTAYTITVMLPANAPEQGAFAIRSAGHAIANLNVASNSGMLSKTSGPDGKSTAWVLDTSAVPGATVSAAVTTDTALTGKSTFIVTPGNMDRSSWYDAILCQFPKGTPVPSSNFTAQKKATYNAATGTWREAVTLPGPGKVEFRPQDDRRRRDAQAADQGRRDLGEQGRQGDADAPADARRHRGAQQQRRHQAQPQHRVLTQERQAGEQGRRPHAPQVTPAAGHRRPRSPVAGRWSRTDRPTGQ